MTDFKTWMQSIQAQTEASLKQFLPHTDLSPSRLHQAMSYATLDGGKRVRPMLVHATGHLFDAPITALSHAACAIEMIHAYSLVHDDMPCMDNDEWRRGKPTVHKQYDQATALLVGDALQAQAFYVLSQTQLPAQQVLSMIQILSFASGSAGMCGGQAIDLDSVNCVLDKPELERMHQLKTGALLQASVLLGGHCGTSPLSIENEKALKDYAQAIGLAFQVVDDILDATEDSATLGKTAGKDAHHHKPTYVSILGLDASKTLAKQLAEQAHDTLSLYNAAAFQNRAIYLHEIADLIINRRA